MRAQRSLAVPLCLPSEEDQPDSHAVENFPVTEWQNMIQHMMLLIYGLGKDDSAPFPCFVLRGHPVTAPSSSFLPASLHLFAYPLSPATVSCSGRRRCQEEGGIKEKEATGLSPSIRYHDPDFSLKTDQV